MANITNFLNKIKTAVHGKDVRGAIHDAIKQVYDDASVNHDNANMEVKMARGTHNTLNDRLDNVDEIQAQTNAQLSQKASEQALAVERARIDSFTKLNEGSTTGDAELIDARVGADGIVYQNLGEAIRNQIGSNITPYISLPFELIPDYYIDHRTGAQTAHTQTQGVYFASDFVKLISNESINIKNLNYAGSDFAGLAFYSDSKTFISGYQYNDETDLTVGVPEGAVYVRFTLKNHNYFNSVVVYQNQYNAITVVAQNTKVLSDKLNVLMNETDVTENVSGVYISSDGYVFENGGATFHISNPISVKKYSTLIVKAEGYKSNVAILSKCLDDGDKYECLVPSEEKVYEYVYSVPEDMEVVLCSSMSIQWQLHIIELFCEPIKDLSEEVSNIDEKVSNVFVPYNVANTNAYINYSIGKEVLGQTPNLASTDYVNVANMKSFTVKNLKYGYNDLAGLCFYDKDKVFIKGHQYNKDVDLTVDVPEKAVYVRLTLVVKYLDITCITSNVVDMVNSLENAIQRLNTEYSHNYEYCQIFHKIAGIGDSLMSGELAFWSEEEQKNRFVDCYNYSWLSNLCKNIGAEAVHYSRGGQTTKTWLAEQLTKMKQETILPSAYYIALGTNDSSEGELPQGLGTFDDCGTDKETFYALYSKIIREIQAFNPHAKIFCCSLYYENGDTSTKFCNAIKEMSEKHGCYYVDFINTYGQFYKNSSPFISVGHFTSPGYVRVGREMQILTNEIISENQSDFRFVGLEHKEI